MFKKAAKYLILTALAIIGLFALSKNPGFRAVLDSMGVDGVVESIDEFEESIKNSLNQIQYQRQQEELTQTIIDQYFNNYKAGDYAGIVELFSQQAQTSNNLLLHYRNMGTRQGKLMDYYIESSSTKRIEELQTNPGLIYSYSVVSIYSGAKYREIFTLFEPKDGSKVKITHHSLNRIDGN